MAIAQPAQDVVGGDGDGGITAVRARIRQNAYTGPTAGLAPGRLQGNLVILGGEDAVDFRTFCKRNPKPCPLVGLSAPGDPYLRELGDIDIRTDVPAYRVYERGRHTRTVDDIKDLWRDDFVAFVLGCSFTFEQALVDAGIAMPHLDKSRSVPMYKTSIETVPAGAFCGPTVVSMRSMAPGDVARAIEVTSQFDHAHGAPVHAGDPAVIGIADLAKPDYGDPPDFRDGDVPVFWACGVTPQSALEQAKPEICITHEPGAMLITDRLATDTRIVA